MPHLIFSCFWSSAARQRFRISLLKTEAQLALCGSAPAYCAGASKKRNQNVRSKAKKIARKVTEQLPSRFSCQSKSLLKDKSADPEDRDEYTADNIFWVNKAARWSYLQGRAKQPTIGKDLDDAIGWAAKIPMATYGSIEVRPTYAQ